MAPHSMGRAFRFDLFCLLLYASLHAVVRTSPTHPQECVSLSEHWCPAPGGPCPCVSTPLTARSGSMATTSSSGDSSSVPHLAILCCHLTDASQLWRGVECRETRGRVVEGAGPVALHIRNSTLQGLAHCLANLPPLPALSSLTITHSAIPLGDMHHGPLATMASTVACLNLSSNGMGDLPTEALTGLRSLRALDLSHNNITHLPDLPPRMTNHQKSLWVDVLGNERLLCSGIKDAMSWNTSASVGALSASPVVLSNASSHDAAIVVAASPSAREEAQPPVYFHNKEHTYCITLMTEYWFDWAERISLNKIEHINKLECPSGEGYKCVCTVKRLEKSDFLVAVDCSGRGLTELPAKLPYLTTSLNVTNNKITSLEPLGRSEYYNKIRDFYAENNRIASIEVLEGSEFLNNFQNLALSGNKLTNLPMYILNRMFRESNLFRLLTLGKNDYHCDCNTYNGLKDWVLHNKKQIPDHEEMLCDSEAYYTRIVDLQADDVCLQKDWKDYLPFVVLVEVVLLIGLLTKVSYDYWIFKTKGYLPWPASRTPKLPCCDWAFDA